MNLRQIIKTSLVRTGLVNFLIHKTRQQLRILMYHGVSPSSVTEEIFAQHLKFIQKHFTCYWMREVPELLNTLSKGHVPEKPPLVLTFDDGLKNNLTKAVPLLKKYNIKATFFLVSDLLKKPNTMLWNHETQCLLMLINNSNLPKEIGPFSSNKKERWPQVKSFVNTIKKMPGEKRVELLNTLQSILPKPSYEDWMFDEFVLMSEKDVLSLPDFIEIGSHTLTHPILTQISDAEARNEIQISLKELENLTGKQIHSFCYPNGNFLKRDLNFVREVYKAAVSVEEGLVSPHIQNDDLFHLKRIPAANNMNDFIFRFIRPTS